MQTLEKAIVTLAAQCDGATTVDGKGFNGGDAMYGNSLAAQINQGRSLSLKQQEAAVGMIVKYKKQLDTLGVCIDEVKGVPRERPRFVVANPIGKVVVLPVGPSEADCLAELRLGLSEQQQQAFDLILTWWELGAVTPFVLRGFSGTGKSFSIQVAIKALKIKCGVRVALCAPTHKARKVLADFAHKAGLEGVYVGTLHSLLHVKPGHPDADGKCKIQPNDYSQEPYYSDFGLVIIDEGSMVGDELFKYVSRQNRPTIFMGDPAQLPPVEDDAKESPIFDNPTGIELTQVMRYEGAIADYVTAIRQDINAQHLPRVSTGGNISKLKVNDWLEVLLEKSSSVEAKADRDYVRALAWTNKRVGELNQYVRSSLFPDSDHYVIGELLTAKDCITTIDPMYGEKRVFMHSCQECTVSAVERNILTLELWDKDLNPRTFTWESYRLSVQTDMGDEDVLTVLHPDEWRMATAHLNTAKNAIMNADKQLRSSLWRQWYEFCEKINVTFRGKTMLGKLQYGYCLTVHQSQGSTFEHVFVDTPNIFACRGIKLRNQLLYVACSRPSEQLYLASRI